MSMIERTVIDGVPATVAYLTNDWKPAEKGEEDLIKVVYDSGLVVFAVPTDKLKGKGVHPTGAGAAARGGG
jgi:hypothetical protein